MELKHTASPWAVRGWRITGSTAAADYVATEAVKEAMPEVFVRTVGQLHGIGKAAVCTVYGMSAEEAEANALLLAAAPELLAAAEAAKAILGRQKWLDTSTDPEALALRQLRAAIVKATGIAA